MALDDYRCALVTGASSGIGAAMVRALRARGLETHALARRRERLQALAEETGCNPIELDLCDTDALYRALDGLEVDILVNNAGVAMGAGRPLFDTGREDIEATTNTNVLSLLHVIRAVVPGMVARKRGHIVNIGSVAGLMPLISSLYGASKGAVHLLNQNLRVELLGSGVRVTEICPGRVRTEIFEVSYDDPEKARAATGGFTLLEPEDIADAILYALDAPWRVNVATIEILPTEQALGGVLIKAVERG
jgi:3-hydroxy acid dehydrogenase/malonic semialdehyde reductase